MNGKLKEFMEAYLMRKINFAFITLIVLLIACCSWIYISLKNPCSYFSAPIYSIITIALGIFVSYYLVQKKTDKRKQTELAEKLIEQAKGKILSLSTLLHSNDISTSIVLGLKRAINNKLHNCKETHQKENTNIKIDECLKDVQALDAALEEIFSLEDDLIKNLSNNKRKLCKILEDIEYHCDQVLISLWTSNM